MQVNRKLETLSHILAVKRGVTRWQEYRGRPGGYHLGPPDFLVRGFADAARRWPGFDPKYRCQRGLRLTANKKLVERRGRGRTLYPVQYVRTPPGPPCESGTGGCNRGGRGVETARQT